MSCAQGFEISGVTQSSDHCARGQGYQSKAVGPVDDVNAEVACVEALARTELQAVELVAVVADEDQWTTPLEHFPVDIDLHREERKATQHQERRPHESRPLATTQPVTQLVALLYNLRIQAKTRVIEEDTTVDASDIHVRHA